MQQDLFITLIEKYLAGKASREEMQLLEEYYTRMGRKDVSMHEQAIESVRSEIVSSLQARIQSTGVTPAPVRVLRYKWWIAAAMLVIVAGAIFFVSVDKRQPEMAAAPAPSSPANSQAVIPMVEIRAGKNKLLDTVLSDGTHVHLNRNTVLRCPVVFASNERLVELEGEAFFDVEHDTERPFRIKAGKEWIEDKGTVFNVRAWPNKPVTVVLVEGKVTVNQVSLQPGQQYTEGHVSKADLAEATAWLHSFSEDRIVTIDRFPVETTATFQKLADVPVDGIKTMFLPNDSTLLLHDTKPPVGNYLFRAFSLNTWKQKGGYIKTPAGPNGIVIAPFAGMHRRNTIWAYDMTSQVLLTMPLGKNAGALRSYYINKPFYNVQLMDSARVAGCGDNFVPLEMQEYDLITNKETASYGELEKGPANLQPTAWKDANQAFLFLRPAGDKIVVAKRFMDQVRIYDLHTKRSVLIKGPEHLPLEFSSIKVAGIDNYWVMVRTAKTHMAFHGGMVNDEFIYLLYSGVPDEGAYLPASRTLGAGQYLFVYDWNGNPVKKIKLDRFITSFTVSEDNTTIYANHNQTNPSTIYKAKLK